MGLWNTAPHAVPCMPHWLRLSTHDATAGHCSSGAAVRDIPTTPGTRGGAPPSRESAPMGPPVAHTHLDLFFCLVHTACYSRITFLCSLSTQRDAPAQSAHGAHQMMPPRTTTSALTTERSGHGLCVSAYKEYAYLTTKCHHFRLKWWHRRRVLP